MTLEGQIGLIVGRWAGIADLARDGAITWGDLSELAHAKCGGAGVADLRGLVSQVANGKTVPGTLRLCGEVTVALLDEAGASIDEAARGGGLDPAPAPRYVTTTSGSSDADLTIDPPTASSRCCVDLALLALPGVLDEDARKERLDRTAAFLDDLRAGRVEIDGSRRSASIGVTAGPVAPLGAAALGRFARVGGAA